MLSSVVRLSSHTVLPPYHSRSSLVVLGQFARASGLCADSSRRAHSVRSSTTPPKRHFPRVISTAEEAVRAVHSNSTVFIHSVASAPQALIKALVARAPELRNVTTCSIHTEGAAPYTEPQYAESFRHSAFFIGANVREAVNAGRADFTPIFLSEIPQLFKRGLIPVNVALISVSKPDRHGYCSLGPSVDCSLAAVENADVVIAQINSHVPRCHGSGLIDIRRHVDFVIEKDEPIPTLHEKAASPEVADINNRIGRNVAALVENGSTLQMGIGAIPDATLACLSSHSHLGIHTEMFSEGLIDLVNSGVVTNRYKEVNPGVITGSFLLGSKRLYDFVDDNPNVQLMPCDLVNDPSLIKLNPKVVAINSAIELDLTGQVSADSIGSRFYSGIGGQMDFERGAALSPGGKPVIALPSVTSRGESRIVPSLKPHAGVVTTRAHVHWVATEYGAVFLFGKSVRARAEKLISIAHPQHRERLAHEASQWLKCKIQTVRPDVNENVSYSNF